ncbi:MAG TPA: C2H2-type zinc finger protein [Nitrososphaera sp.]|nr:C2H2-type zinc finger protein [Nitrososphaera sp.]
MASRTDTARVTCTFCGKSFPTQAEMEEHTKRDHTEQKDPVGVG